MTADAADYFLILGGGPTPFSNQVSLESNVLFAQRVLGRVRDDSPDQRVFFADGDIAKRDLQFRETGCQRSAAVTWMNHIFGDRDSIDLRYRNHTVKANGPTRKAFVKQAFYELADQLTADDRLIVYVTAHGGEAESESYYGSDYSDYEYSDYSESGNPYDTTIALWNNDSLSVSELNEWLNKFTVDTQIVLIMAQCHSGGFAHSIFHDADQERGLNPQLRIGFFSQRHDRAAAGCTAEIDESSYREYSTYFWEAVGGTTRGGETIDSPDYNDDGQVSLAEAHAHAVITSNTIDIPITSSDAFLRQYSKIAPTPKQKSEKEKTGGVFSAFFGGSKSADKPQPSDQDDASESEPLASDQTIDQIVALARAEQKAIIETICKSMEIQADEELVQIRSRANELEEAADEASQLWAAATVLIAGERQSLSGSLVLQWPELGYQSFTPKMAELIQSEADDFVAFIEADPHCDSYRQAFDKAQSLSEKRDAALNSEAKMRRLMRTLENVLLEANLPHHASETQLKHFQRMLAAEQAGLAVVSQSRGIGMPRENRH